MNETETSFKGWGLLSKYRVELMGASIIWIMLYHGYRNDMRFPGKLNFINFILSEGASGVEIFLLLSGLGLYYSFSKNSNLKYFYKNRVKRVILPYLLVSGGFWIGQDLLYHKSISTFLKNITLYSFWKDGYNRLWYFALIIPLYLIFPILYYYIYGKREYSKKQVLARASSLIIFTLLLNFCVRCISKSYYELTEIALSRIVIFLLGILVGSYAKRNEKVSYGAMVLILLTYSTRLYDYESDLGDMFLRCWYIPLCFVVCFVLIYFFELLNLKAKPNFILSKILSIAGKYSMELYIVHIWMRKFFNTISIDYHFHGINFNKFELLDYFLVLVSSLIITFFFVQIEKFLFQRQPLKTGHKI